MQLTNKVAIVTGASGGLGRAIALALAAQGASLVLASRNTVALEETQRQLSHIQEHGQRAIVVPTDVQDEASVQHLVEETLRQFEGRIDILVCNSGIAGPTAPLIEVKIEQWQETLATNLTGPFLCCRAVLPTMLEQQAGSVILIGSGTGKHPLIGRTPYAASKIALVGMARTLAMEVGPSNVRVNVVSPGPLDGERIQAVLQKQAELRHMSYEQIKAQATSGSALKRFTPVQDVADTVVFLASDQAASITGEDMNVSGGLVMV
ncbi:sorbitol 6-phosphate dehydrogenase [Ktedonobacteria bacterium brp13]|nr:sorbitol 6-phosphate dehydrogenase [Ktedonobacteria bacterium brp13]